MIIILNYKINGSVNNKQPTEQVKMYGGDGTKTATGAGFFSS